MNRGSTAVDFPIAELKSNLSTMLVEAGIITITVVVVVVVMVVVAAMSQWW